MAINNVAGKWVSSSLSTNFIATQVLQKLQGRRVYYVRDILREFLGHNFVFGLRTLKHKNKLFLKRCFSSLDSH